MTAFMLLLVEIRSGFAPEAWVGRVRSDDARGITLDAAGRVAAAVENVTEVFGKAGGKMPAEYYATMLRYQQGPAWIAEEVRFHASRVVATMPCSARYQEVLEASLARWQAIDRATETQGETE